MRDVSGDMFPIDDEAASSPGYLGHRKRLRERFLAGGAEALPDYELLELLLFSALPRRDTKPIAKALIAEFGSFADVISATPDRLMQIDGVKDSAVTIFKAVQAAAQRLTKAGITNGPLLNNFLEVIDYCKTTIALDAVEQFRVLFLNGKLRLIKDESLGRGTVDMALAYVREIVKRALEVGAKSIVLVHNHPSGDPKPSQTDIETTRRIKDACATVGIFLHDHIVVARGGYVSFRQKGLI